MNTFLVGRHAVNDIRADYPDLNTSDRYNYQRRSLGDIDRLVIHHWASHPYPLDLAIADELAAMEAVRQQWMARDEYHNTAGYPYHFTVFPSGRSYYNGDVATSRANVAKNNNHVVGIALPGNFMAVKPGQKQLDETRTLVANLQLALGSFVPVVPHRSFGDTQCPGDTWPQWGPYVQVHNGP